MLLERSDYIVAKIWNLFSTVNLTNFANFLNYKIHQILFITISKRKNPVLVRHLRRRELYSVVVYPLTLEEYANHQVLGWALQYYSGFSKAQHLFYWTPNSTWNISDWVQGHSSSVTQLCDSLPYSLSNIGWSWLPFWSHIGPGLCISLSHPRPWG
jgi:hypothetical protein